MPRNSTPRRPADDTPIANPYVRISDPTQRQGGGLERQTSADLKSFCKQFGFELSKKIWIDDGVSAWDGSNLNEELGRFLQDARRGLIRPGDCLLVENLDRIARHGRRGRRFMDEIQDLGIHVGVLQGCKLYDANSDDLADTLIPMLEFHRGQLESDAKSFRNKDRWQKKRDAARTKGSTMTQRLPAWIREVNGKREKIPERAVVIQQIFTLARSDCGLSLIVKKLIEESVPPFGDSLSDRDITEHLAYRRAMHAEGRCEPVTESYRASLHQLGRWASEPDLTGEDRKKKVRVWKQSEWSRTYICEILMDRRVLGELQPRFRNGEPAGEVIKDYYPAVVTEDEFAAARLGAGQRKKHRGRLGQNVNPFAGLVKDALAGDSYVLTSCISAGKMRKILVNMSAKEGRSTSCSYPYVEFLAAMLKCLREIDPHSILNGDQGPDETTVLGGRLASVERELADAKAWMKKRREEGKSFSAEIANDIAELEEKQKEVTERLREARHRAAHPLSEVWGEAQDLMAALETTEDPISVRLRLRAKLREIIDTIRMLIVVRGRVRLGAVQVWFAGGKRRRDYLIFYKSQQCNAKVRIPSCWWVKSLSEVLGDEPSLDLRRRDHADALRIVLEAAPLNQ